jgi:hypothetical protein
MPLTLLKFEVALLKRTAKALITTLFAIILIWSLITAVAYAAETPRDIFNKMAPADQEKVKTIVTDNKLQIGSDYDLQKAMDIFSKSSSGSAGSQATPQAGSPSTVATSTQGGGTFNYYNFASQGSDGNLAVGNTGFTVLDSAVRMISRFFMIPSLRTNRVVQIGFIRFLLFVMLFSLFRFGLARGPFKDDAKTTNILSFVIALIGVIFMKDQWVMAQGGVMAAVAGLLVPLLIAIPALIYSFSSGSNGSGSNNEGARNWIGVGVLFGALIIILLYMNITGFTAPLFMFLLVPQKALEKFFRGAK